MSYGSDKRLIINAREPKENEFVLHTGVNINDRWVEHVMDYIDKHSNLHVEWINSEHFVAPGMMGFRLVRKNNDT